MAKKQPSLEVAICDRLDHMLSLDDLLDEGNVSIDELARRRAQEAIRGGLNLRLPCTEDDEALIAALPEHLRERFRRHLDAVEGLYQYYAEAGYEIGRVIGRRVRLDGAR